MSATSSELRVFISSTFKDLQEEREHLIKKVFPEIRTICRERGVEFTEIDLRWGLTEEEASLGQIIRTCLEEIDRCRPYFIGILGDRYGWVPEFYVIQKDADLLRHYPWIEDAAADGASIVEMEFLYGALMHPSDDADGTLFYMRSTNGDASQVEQKEHEKLDRLVRKTRAVGYPLVEFSTPTELGEQVRRDLLEIINRRWPQSAQPSLLENERRAHTAFAAARRRAYIANPNYLRHFNQWIEASRQGKGETPEHGSSPLVISAPSGFGKSALIAYLEQSYHRRMPHEFIVAHYVGASVMSNDPAGIIWHVMAEIREQYGLDDELPTTSEETVRAFPEWLAKVDAARPLLLLIDAVNQLDAPADMLGWLPDYIPLHVHLVISTTPGETLDRLRERGWQELQLQPLTVDECEALVVRFLGEYHKRLSHHLTRRIAEDEKSAAPLFLRTLLEELRLFGDFERLDENVGHYLMSRDTDDLFRWVLERMEHDYGHDAVFDLMSLVACSRRGLSETELLEISGLSRVELSRLLHVLDYHLLRRDGLLDFFHDYLRTAVERRYLAHPERIEEMHLKIANHFEQMIESGMMEAGIVSLERIASELPWQLRQVEQWERLKNCVTSAAIVQHLVEHDRQHELLGYWLAIGERYDMAEAYRQEIARLEEVGTESSTLATLLHQLGTFMTLAARYDAAEQFLERALRMRELEFGAEHPLTVQSLTGLGELSLVMGKYPMAEQLFRRVLAVEEQLAGPEALETARAIDNLATLLYHRKELDEAEALFKRSLAIREKLLGTEHRETARCAGALGAVYYMKEDHTRAEELLKQALSIAERALGAEHLETAEAMNNLATTLMARGEHIEASHYLQRAIAINERLLGPINPGIAMMLTNLGSSFADMKRTAEAEKAQRRAINISEKLLGKDHLDVAPKLINLHRTLMMMGRFDEAEAVLQRALALRQNALGPNHIDTIQTFLNLAGLLKEKGEYGESLRLYREHSAAKERLLGFDHPSTQRSWRACLDLLQRMGLHEEADALSRRLEGFVEQ